MVERINLNERLYITKHMLEEQEREFIMKRHIERYSLARQFARGKVLDFGCGSGYGSYLMALNPDVDYMTGYDLDNGSVEFAKEQYQLDNLEYRKDIEGLEVDTLVAVEVIEHIKDIDFIPNLADEVKAKRVVVSYPTKKTTHYNPKHFHDFKRWQLEAMFKDYKLIGDYNLWHECELLVFERRGEPC